MEWWEPYVCALGSAITAYVVYIFFKYKLWRIDI